MHAGGAAALSLFDPSRLDFEQRFTVERERHGLDGWPTPTGRLESTTESLDVLSEGNRAWDGLEDFREERRRSRDYYWGDQWRDKVLMPDGTIITEDEMIRKENRIPWRMNQIRPAVRNLKGQYRQNQSARQAFATQPEGDIEALALTTHLRAGRRLNKMRSLEADLFQEFLISGLAVGHIGWKWWSSKDRHDIFAQRIPTPRFFYNIDLRDRRLVDLRLVGALYDLSLEEIIEAFAPQDPTRARAIAEAYQFRQERDFDASHPFGFTRDDTVEFLAPTEFGKSRVIEIWTRRGNFRTFAFDPNTGGFGRLDLADEQIALEQQARAEQGLLPLQIETRFETYWYGFYLTPSGEILFEGESPHWHQEHPFVLGFAELFDGQTKGLVADIIDQQRLYNRMIAMMDKMMATAARGVLLIPEEMIPAGMTPEQFADDYATINGVIVYRAKDMKNLPPGIKPQQVYANSIPAGAFQWLQTMVDNIERSSGVRGPVMGETAKSGVPAALFNQQIIQGQINNLDTFETFFEFVQDLDHKHMQLILQYQDDTRVMRSEAGEFVEYRPEDVQQLEYDVTIGSVSDTSTMRQLFEADMLEHLNSGRLTFRQFLAESANPKSQSLLETIERTNPLLQSEGQGLQGSDGQPIDPEFERALMQAAQLGDQDAAALLTQAQ